MNRTTRLKTVSYQRNAYTLIELVIASASSTILVGGLASSIFIASKSLDVADGSLAESRSANKIVHRINRDLQSAVLLSELTATSVTMSVPDRDGDSVPETIRYAWSGTAGDPLTHTYNGGTTETIATDVQSFSMSWISRLLEGVTSLPIVLFVSSQSPDNGALATPSTAEQAQVDAIEGWGYDVTVISEQASQVEFDAEFANATVVYVPGTISVGTLASKLNLTSLGVVTESIAHAKNIGFYDSLAAFNSNQATISLINTTHYITEVFSPVDLTIAEADQSIKWTTSTLAPDAAKLAHASGAVPYPTLLILDAGDELADASAAAGRRCQLPWGEGTFSMGSLNADGLIIMQRAIEWAAGAGDDTETIVSGIAYEESTESQASSATDNITIDVPSGYSENDLLIAVVVTDGNEAGSMSAPAGWTEIYLGEDNGGRTTLGIWWKLASVSEPSNYDFDWSSNEEAYGSIKRFTGHRLSNPIHDTATTQGSSSAPNTAAVTTTEDNCMILRIGAFDDDDVSVGDAGMTDHTTIVANESGSGSGTCSAAAAYEMQDTAGSSGTASFSLGGSEEYRTVTIAIEPEPTP